jgi:hypothetical protein
VLISLSLSLSVSLSLYLSLSKLILRKRHGYRKKYGHMKVQEKKRKKIWTHEGPSKKEKKVGHMKVQEKKKKKRKDSHVHKRIKVERGSCKMELQQIRW